MAKEWLEPSSEGIFSNGLNDDAPLMQDHDCWSTGHRRSAIFHTEGYL